jgi:hypothetical protein
MPILGGILTFESDWRPPLGATLEAALGEGDDAGRLDLGCVGAHGHFVLEPTGKSKRDERAYIFAGASTFPMLEFVAL